MLNTSPMESLKQALLFVQQMSQIWYVTQYEVVGEGKCFFSSNNLILSDLDYIKCTKE